MGPPRNKGRPPSSDGRWHAEKYYRSWNWWGRSAAWLSQAVFCFGFARLKPRRPEKIGLRKDSSGPKFHSDPLGFASKIFLREVATINRVGRRGERLRVSSRRASTSTSSTCFASLRCLRQCCCFLRWSRRCWEYRAKVLFSMDHGPSWRLLLSRRGSQLALSAWIWRAAQALTSKLKWQWK